MADVLGEYIQQRSVVQECVQLLAARQELWEPLPDVTGALAVSPSGL